MRGEARARVALAGGEAATSRSLSPSTVEPRRWGEIAHRRQAWLVCGELHEPYAPDIVMRRLEMAGWVDILVNNARSIAGYAGGRTARSSTNSGMSTARAILLAKALARWPPELKSSRRLLRPHREHPGRPRAKPDRTRCVLDHEEVAGALHDGRGAGRRPDTVTQSRRPSRRPRGCPTRGPMRSRCACILRTSRRP